jgi:hypothetical protein
LLSYDFSICLLQSGRWLLVLADGNMAIHTFVSAKAILTENDEANGSQFAVKG